VGGRQIQYPGTASTERLPFDEAQWEAIETLETSPPGTEVELTDPYLSATRLPTCVSVWMKSPGGCREYLVPLEYMYAEDWASNLREDFGAWSASDDGAPDPPDMS